MAKTNEKEVKGTTNKAVAKSNNKTIKNQEKEIKNMAKKNGIAVGTELLIKVRREIKRFTVLGIEEKAILVEDENGKQRKFIRNIVEAAFKKQDELAEELAEDEEDVDIDDELEDEEIEEEEVPKKGAKGKGKKVEEEEVVDEEDDLESALEELSLGQLKRVARELGTPKAELFDRDEADLITIILDFDEDDVWESVKKFESQSGSPKKGNAKSKEKESRNDNKRYWENEDPIACEMEDYEIRFYEDACRFQLFGCYQDKKSEERKVGKGVTVKTDELTNKEAMKFISNVVYAMGDAVTDERITDIIEQLETLNKEVNPEDYVFEKDELNEFNLKTVTAIANGLDINTKKIEAKNKKLAIINKILKAQQ